MHEGIIIRIVEGRGFGFISSPNQPDVFFHASDIIDDGLEFCEALTERRVRFDIINTSKGPRAKNIQAAE